jgi:hypothetical protein
MGTSGRSGGLQRCKCPIRGSTHVSKNERDSLLELVIHIP